MQNPPFTHSGVQSSYKCKLMKHQQYYTCINLRLSQNSPSKLLKRQKQKPLSQKPNGELQSVLLEHEDIC